VKHITSYTDFRVYLKEWIKERKARKLPASNRWIADKVGINSSSWLTTVLQGRKGLSKRTIDKLSRVLKHTIVETRYFETLVFFNQAKKISERNEYYERLISLRKQKKVKKISEERYDYYSQWYHSAIRAIIGFYPFKGDYVKLAGMVSPPITPAQARKSISLLEKLNFIRLSENGCYRLTDTAITTGDHVKSLAISNFQQETMRLAQEAMDRYNKDIRDISTLTIGVSKEKIEIIKEILEETRDKIAEIANSEKRGDCVFQVNLQFFPLSNLPAAKGAKS